MNGIFQNMHDEQEWICFGQSEPLIFIIFLTSRRIIISVIAGKCLVKRRKKAEVVWKKQYFTCIVKFYFNCYTHTNNRHYRSIHELILKQVLGLSKYRAVKNFTSENRGGRDWWAPPKSAPEYS